MLRLLFFGLVDVIVRVDARKGVMTHIKKYIIPVITSSLYQKITADNTWRTFYPLRSFLFMNQGFPLEGKHLRKVFKLTL